MKTITQLESFEAFMDGFRTGQEHGELSYNEAYALCPADLDEFSRDRWVHMFTEGTIDGSADDRFRLRMATRGHWEEDMKLA